MSESDLAPMREVTRVHELRGPKGGTQLVHMLDCGDWIAIRRKAPAKRLRCIACWIRAIDAEPAP